MNKIIILITVITFTLVSCKNEDPKYIETGEKIIHTEIFSDSQLESQYFEINTKRDTSLISKNGTIIKIYSNSFEVSDSIEFIEFEVKEAFEPIDFVKGNLTTLNNDRFLVSEGMIFINAKSGEHDLNLEEGSEIGFIVETNSIDEKMMIYQGERDSSKLINWISPKPIDNSRLRTLEKSYVTITIQYESGFDSDHPKLNEWLWRPKRKIGDIIVIDNVEIEVTKITKNLVSLRENEKGLFIPDVITNKGRNGYVDDFNTSYIFSVNEMGWANIDKLFENPKSSEVNMLANIKNETEFGYVFTTLILPQEKMHIPGYQKLDNSFGFTSNDDEQLILPIGSEAIIMATAYKNDKPYFNLEKIIIQKELNLSFVLNETTIEELKKTIEDQI